METEFAGPITRPFPDEFERTTWDGITVKFRRKVDIPNENFWDLLVGRKYIGYFCLPPYSRLWHVTIDFSSVKHRATFKNPADGVLNIVKTIEAL